MTDVVVATSDRDAAAAAAVEQHHAQMAGALRMEVEAVIAAAARPDAASAARQAAQTLVTWCRRELVPHALAEEQAMYPAAHETVEGKLLVTGMLAEHAVIVGLVREVAEASDAVRAAAAAKALLVAFESHLAKENELVLPLLARTPGVSVADLLGGMHELLGGPARDAEPEAAAGCGGHACACGETDGPGYPELDVRQVPHAIRHATVFGALETVEPGGGLVLVAPHDPLPLLAQVSERFDGRFAVEYVERGPDTWRLAFVQPAVA